MVSAKEPKRIAILGSTGSIGTSTLDVVRAFPGRFRVVALSAHSQAEELARQIEEFEPEVAALTNETHRRDLVESLGDTDVELLWGEKGPEKIAGRENLDLVLSAIAGAAGLPAAARTLRSGHTLALANKEALVMAGGLLKELSRAHNARILPVDSEHSAIDQALKCGTPEEVSRIILTASGGPFYGRDPEELAKATPEEALDHPNWDMGAKISIDSATMMNKGLEIIEACWLFDVPADKVTVVIHPQSLVHSMVEFVDGSIMAQLGPRDMKLPIQHALTHPEHVEGPVEKLDLTDLDGLQFRPAPPEEFPALELGYRAAREKGVTGAVLNAADEEAVAAFLEKRIGFNDILPCVRHVMDSCPKQAGDTLTFERILEADRWAREEASTWLP